MNWIRDRYEDPCRDGENHLDQCQLCPRWNQHSTCFILGYIHSSISRHTFINLIQFNAFQTSHVTYKHLDHHPCVRKMSNPSVNSISSRIHVCAYRSSKSAISTQVYIIQLTSWLVRKWEARSSSTIKHARNQFTRMTMQINSIFRYERNIMGYSPRLLDVCYR